MNILLAIAAFVFMECVAWFTHKYIMHGILWKLHKDHHQKDEAGFFEKNDFFFLIFAIPAMLLFITGGLLHLSSLLWIATGITLYGAAYFLVHDVFIHQRFKWFRNTKNPYMLAIRRAHKMHHKHLNKNDGECFGMLFVPFKYYRLAWQAKGEM
ncbi:beta-carotene hydroxylase [Terrimonas sp.]|uniref:sterol desaturase family protein n=1 Tax=Terrimonas sp. TaxID=1914338 RepID=UPI000D508341|nr:sterol desaturase family protein [Terrimonas sp.]PVD52326.1 beta-carotene hydroxylase [Terrimonas sp.]